MHLSPVWATVLMVATTILLAAGLFLVVSKYTEDYVPPEPQIYTCDCGWSGYLSDCTTEVTTTFTYEYDMLQERYVTVYNYYRCYFCPDCGELLHKVFMYQTRL